MNEENRKKKLLLLDCDQSVHDEITNYFSGSDIDVISVYNGRDAIGSAASIKPDIIVMDTALPDMDGYELCSKIKSEFEIPVIVISGLKSEDSCFNCLKAGAFNYIAKPYDMNNLAKSINLALHCKTLNERKRNKRRITADNLVIDKESLLVTLNGNEIHVTQKELEILWVLVSNAGKILSRDFIIKAVWKEGIQFDSRTIDFHIKNIRNKLKNPENKWTIKAVYGQGFRFEIKND